MLLLFISVAGRSSSSKTIPPDKYLYLLVHVLDQNLLKFHKLPCLYSDLGINELERCCVLSPGANWLADHSSLNDCRVKQLGEPVNEHLSLYCMLNTARLYVYCIHCGLVKLHAVGILSATTTDTSVTALSWPPACSRMHWCTSKNWILSDENLNLSATGFYHIHISCSGALVSDINIRVPDSYVHVGYSSSEVIANLRLNYPVDIYWITPKIVIPFCPSNI